MEIFASKEDLKYRQHYDFDFPKLFKFDDSNEKEMNDPRVLLRDLDTTRLLPS